ncbi:hypothetical protein XENOCAPTIV_005019, partial [Xenoophorus captivus]
PIKAGGLVFVLDHSRWTQPMRDAIDQLLIKHHGQKDFLCKVDAEYAACVQASLKDPNSLLHPTTKQHISRYIKHLAKMENTKSSLNISPEELLETQQLWHHLTEGSETVSAPVVTIPPATVNPPSKVLSLYQPQGMTGEMTWREFCQSSFYETEKERWAAEKGK